MRNTSKYIAIRRSPFHRVEPSPWPILTALGLGFTALRFVFWLHGDSLVTVLFGLRYTAATFSRWMHDIVLEATFLGKHTKLVQRGIRMGFALFLVTEAMFFVSFFWAFFHRSLNPRQEVGHVWPPEMHVIRWKGVPMANTGLLLGTILPCSVAIKAIRSCQLDISLGALALTMFMGGCFMVLQGYEYYTAKFTMADGIYGRTFFALTGLHGIHVVGGLVFLLVGYCRMWLGHFSRARHLGLTFAV